MMPAVVSIAFSRPSRAMAAVSSPPPMHLPSTKTRGTERAPVSFSSASCTCARERRAQRERLARARAAGGVRQDGAARTAQAGCVPALHTGRTHAGSRLVAARVAVQLQQAVLREPHGA